ncbi:MAG: 6-phosphogluconolactonase [Deltaproteobacteria bacterium]|nr:MAG: 6-phosphogluconolactonase [Deltaproteobacteria bacterium]
MIHQGNIFIFDNNEGVADFAVTKWIEISSEAIVDKGYFSAALSGGKTPVAFYKRLAVSKDILSWDRTRLFFADERFVPPSHDESNYGLIEKHLLRQVSILDENVHRIQTEGITLEQSARRYEEDIRSFFRIEGGAVPQFDLIMLGIGEDGHTASLFPGKSSLHERVRLAIPVTANKFPHERITLTLPVINNARNIMFLVSGRTKAKALKEILENKESRLPASHVHLEQGMVYFMIDQPAASLLSGGKVGKQTTALTGTFFFND